MVRLSVITKLHKLYSITSSCKNFTWAGSPLAMKSAIKNYAQFAFLVQEDQRMC